MMDIQAENKLREALQADEQVLWQGRPKRGLVIRPHDAWMIPVSIVWIALFALGEVGTLTLESPTPDLLWGVLVVLAGFYFLFGRFIHDAWIRKYSYYAVTDRRIIIFHRRRIQSLRLSGQWDVNAYERPDGSGSIYFGYDPRPASPVSRQLMNWDLGTPSGPAFDRIEDVKRVHELIIQRKYLLNAGKSSQAAS